MTLALRLPDGTLVTDGEWECVADVMRSAHGHGVTNMRGIELITLEGDEG